MRRPRTEIAAAILTILLTVLSAACGGPAEERTTAAASGAGTGTAEADPAASDGSAGPARDPTGDHGALWVELGDGNGVLLAFSDEGAVKTPESCGSTVPGQTGFGDGIFEFPPAVVVFYQGRSYWLYDTMLEEYTRPFGDGVRAGLEELGRTKAAQGWPDEDLEAFGLRSGLRVYFQSGRYAGTDPRQIQPDLTLFYGGDRYVLCGAQREEETFPFGDAERSALRSIGRTRTADGEAPDEDLEAVGLPAGLEVFLEEPHGQRDADGNEQILPVLWVDLGDGSALRFPYRTSDMVKYVD